MKFACIAIGIAILVGLVLVPAAVLAQEGEAGSTELAEPNTTEGAAVEEGMGEEQEKDQVDCSEVTDPALHRRSAKSYYGVATKKMPPDLEVMAKAEHQLNLALCGLPDDWEVNMFMGMVKAELGKLELAGYYFQRAVDLAESKKDRKRAADNRAHYWVEHYNEALDFYHQEAYALAADEARLAILIDPTDCRGHTLLGSSLASDSKFEEAVEALGHGIALCPDNENLRENLSIAYTSLGNKYFEGMGGERKPELEQAVYWFDKADSLSADNLDLLFNRGSALLYLVEMGDSTRVDPARRDWRRFVELSDAADDKKIGTFNLGLVETGAESWPAAETTVKAYIQMAPLDAEGYGLMSRILINTDRAQEAETYIIVYNCLKEDPVTDVAAWVNEAKTRYGGGTDFVKTVGEMGMPDEVRVHVDSSGQEMLVLIYWQQGKAVVFYQGEKRGELPMPSEEL